MIVREWRGRAAASKPDAYPGHFRDNVLPGLRATGGFLGATLCRHTLPDGRIEFLVLTRWQSPDAIRAFAGDDLSRAIVEPQGVAALTDYDRTVRHYEVVEMTESRETG